MIEAAFDTLEARSRMWSRRACVWRLLVGSRSAVETLQARRAGSGRAGGGPLRLVAARCAEVVGVSNISLRRDRGRRITDTSAAHPPPGPGAWLLRGTRRAAARFATGPCVRTRSSRCAHDAPRPGWGGPRRATVILRPRSPRTSVVVHRYTTAHHRDTSPERAAPPRTRSRCPRAGAPRSRGPEGGQAMRCSRGLASRSCKTVACLIAYRRRCASRRPRRLRRPRAPSSAPRPCRGPSPASTGLRGPGPAAPRAGRRRGPSRGTP